MRGNYSAREWSKVFKIWNNGTKVWSKHFKVWSKIATHDATLELIT